MAASTSEGTGAVRRSKFLPLLGHEIHVGEWGDPANPAVIMWHGLARTGRDFDEAASALSADFFVLCPDTIGRGLSSWSQDPPAEYTQAFYMQLAVALLGRYGIEKLRWVGTSMGGLLGILLAAGPLKTRISHLVVNDVGPVVPTDALRRIGAYVGAPPTLPTIEAFETWLRQIYASFGENTDAFWRRMALTSMRRTDSGAVTVHYDPAIAEPFRLATGAADIWPVWDAVEVPTLLLRGERSDVLSAGLAAEMTRRGPCPHLVEIADVGHAPSLVSDDQIALLRRFLIAGQAA